MLTPGYSQRLKVLRLDPRGVWLDGDGEELFLPRRECPGEPTEGQEIEVFIYLDRGKKFKATTREPLVQVGEFALLQVKSCAPHGVFLDWGMEKDLFCPYSEQPLKMLEGRRYLVYVDLDRENRPIASGRLEHFLLRENQDLEQGQDIELLVWTFTDLGAKVIINNRYEGLLYRDEIPAGLRRGDRRSGYVLKIRPDGRLDVTLRRPGIAGIEDARTVILAALKDHNGRLDLHDQSPPELIRKRLGLSKKVFKKALGNLYKEGLIQLEQDGIKTI